MTYSLSDDAGTTVGVKSTLDITVTRVDDPFTDANEVTSTPEDTVKTGNVIDGTSVDGPVMVTGFSVDANNDGTPETFTAGQTATITGVGTITIVANGDYTFTPVANFNGTVPTVTYSLSDDAGNTVGDTSILAITVTPVNDAPVDGNEVNRVTQGVTLTVAANDRGGLLQNYSDIDSLLPPIIDSYTINGISGIQTVGAPVTIAGVGVLTINRDGGYQFVPVARYNGAIPVVTYTVDDGNGGMDTSTLTLTISRQDLGGTRPPVVPPTQDTVPPTIAITTDDTFLNVGDTATITFTLSEASSDLVDGDITVTGGTLSTLVQDPNNPLVYTATFTPATGSTTPAVIRVDSIKFTDAAGNANADGTDANNEVRITVDTVAPTVLSSSRVIGRPPFIQKPFEHPPIQMGRYEYNVVTLDFNGAHGGINQFALPQVESTATRGNLGYSNSTPYTYFDRVGDELENAQRPTKTNAIFSSEEAGGLRNPILPPDAKVGPNGNASYTLPPSTFVGGKGDVTLTAIMMDGKPLPAWIKFNPVNGKFDISMPKGMSEPIEIQIIGTDAKGDQAKTKLNIQPPAKDAQKSSFNGKSSFTSQIRSVITLGRG